MGSPATQPSPVNRDESRTRDRQRRKLARCHCIIQINTRIRNVSDLSSAALQVVPGWRRHLTSRHTCATRSLFPKGLKTSNVVLEVYKERHEKFILEWGSLADIGSLTNVSQLTHGVSFLCHFLHHQQYRTTVPPLDLSFLSIVATESTHPTNRIISSPCHRRIVSLNVCRWKFLKISSRETATRTKTELPPLAPRRSRRSNNYSEDLSCNDIFATN